MNFPPTISCSDMPPRTLAQKIRECVPGLRLLENEPMNTHCSFRIGGPAELFAEPSAEGELQTLILLLKQENIPYVVIGRGTNLLVSDEGVRGVVIHLGDALAHADFQNGGISAGAGIPLARLASLACAQGLTGLEFAHGIPGTLGGAVVMNAGAYGGEMKDVVRSVRFLGCDTGKVEETSDLDFAYRHSRFSHGKEIVLSATLSLTPGDPEAIRARMSELSARRANSQPLDKPSAGSTFKRPATGYAAAMIDGAGLKGYTIGGAMVSEKHAGFVVNTGGATCKDVLTLMTHIQQRVREKYGVELEPEVQYIR